MTSKLFTVTFSTDEGDYSINFGEPSMDAVKAYAKHYSEVIRKGMGYEKMEVVSIVEVEQRRRRFLI